MAHIKVKMPALGHTKERCTGCGRNFERGEQMSAVEYENGEPMGWFCDDCIADWKAKGVKSKIFEPVESEAEYGGLQRKR